MIKIILALLIGFFFSACENQKNKIKPSGNVVHIGVMFSTKERDVNARMAFFKLLQEVEGYLDNGDKLQLDLVPVDENFVENFLKLLASKKLVGVISFLNSTDMLKLKPYIESAKIPFIATIATHSDINEIKYVSRICLNNRLEANVAAAYLRDELLIPEVSVIRDKTNLFSLELVEFFIQRYTKLGGVVKHTFEMSLLEENPKKFISMIKKEEVETLYATASSQEMLRLLKLLHKEKLKIKILSYDGLLSEYKRRFPKQTELLNGVYVVDNYANNVKLSSRAKSAIKKGKLDLYTIDVDSYDALSFDAWVLFKEALNACSEHDGFCVNSYMRDINAFEGTSDIIQMKNGNAQRAVFVNEIKDEKMYIKVKVF